MAYNPFRTRIPNIKARVTESATELPIHYTPSEYTATPPRSKSFHRACCCFLLALSITLVASAAVVAVCSLPKDSGSEKQPQIINIPSSGVLGRGVGASPFTSFAERFPYASEDDESEVLPRQLIVPDVQALDTDGDAIPDQPITWTLPGPLSAQEAEAEAEAEAEVDKEKEQESLNPPTSQERRNSPPFSLTTPSPEIANPTGTLHHPAPIPTPPPQPMFPGMRGKPHKLLIAEYLEAAYSVDPKETWLAIWAFCSMHPASCPLRVPPPPKRARSLPASSSSSSTSELSSGSDSDSASSSPSKQLLPRDQSEWQHERKSSYDTEEHRREALERKRSYVRVWNDPKTSKEEKKVIVNDIWGDTSFWEQWPRDLECPMLMPAPEV